MQIVFEKYHGAGNDFIIVNNFHTKELSLTKAQVQHLCDRHFGIGADGLICIILHHQADFEMIYYNADGNISSMCGNGGRCAVAFAKKHKLFEGDTSRFKATDGFHTAQFHADGSVTLDMAEVSTIIQKDAGFVVNTGSPHYVRFELDTDDLNVNEQGAAIRYSPSFSKEGINVNFVSQQHAQQFKISTYERGVENETLACGTGAVAAAIVAHQTGRTSDTTLFMEAKGGVLQVSFEKHVDGYKKVRLTGPATFVFEGAFNF